MKYIEKDNGCLLLVSLLLIGISQSHAKIVFSSKRNGDTDYHIYVMEDNGSNIKRITSVDYYDQSPRWFPDGQRILFERDWGRGNGSVFNAEFYIIDVDGRNECRFMENHPTDYSPSLSPDGTQVAFMSSRRDRQSADISTYHLESGQLKRLTDNLESGARSRRTGWSPDGRKIAYEHESKEDGDNVWIMSAHGGGKHRLSPKGPAAPLVYARGGPRWSPSGRYIMYTEHIWRVNKGHFRGVMIRVVIQEVRTGIRRFHHFSNKDTISDGCWMGDDQTVLLPIEKEWDAPGANYEIYRYDLVRHQLTNLTNQPGGDYDPHWISGTLAVFPGGKLTTLWGKLKESHSDE